MGTRAAARRNPRRGQGAGGEAHGRRARLPEEGDGGRRGRQDPACLRLRYHGDRVHGADGHYPTGRAGVHEGAWREVEANMKKFEVARDAFVKAHQQQILKVLGAVTKMVETGEYHLPDEAKGALLNKWKGIQEDGGNDADADAGANAGAGADINTNTTTAYATPAPSSRRLRGRF